MKQTPGVATRRQFFAAAAGSLAASRARAEGDSGLIAAMEAVGKAIPVALADPDRPVYHFHPPAN